MLDSNEVPIEKNQSDRYFKKKKIDVLNAHGCTCVINRVSFI